MDETYNVLNGWPQITQDNVNAEIDKYHPILIIF